ncbi:set domain containing protein [Niveomyces insectorum RCEF 264]|uniref:Histone-lysine N-methyltransferase SET9 n=1 Tax=Niveomyces insectorum RCEF 264 TaxID=1081102 RepID=A0A162IDD9_9HYPO|nr:set domain containing protein [Niveomyces insectorum RCEF 264]
MAPARSKSSPPKKHTLTLAQIASYDDILTDALVDHAFYWTTIPKNRPSYLPSRGVREEEISNIIQNHLIVNPDLQAAEEKLLATNGLSKFHRALKTEAEKEDFRRHLRRYMQIYLPDCPFEVNATNRYTIFQEEASISARRFIKCHETIKYLSGIQVVITPEEEAQLSARKKDFSIVVSSRKKESNIFMGPARFANHDCDANARLVTTGQSLIEIIATKSIGVGEEITVTYGENYFGENNCECLCKTCEDHMVNGWAPANGSVPVAQSVEEGAGTPIQGYSLRRREENSLNRGHSETPSLIPVARPKVSRTKLKNLVRTAESTPTADDGFLAPALRTTDGEARGQKRGIDALLATPPVTPAKKQKTVSAPVSQDEELGNPSGHADVSPSPFEVAADSKDSNGSTLTIHAPTPKHALFADSIGVLQRETESRELLHDPMPTPEASQQLAGSEMSESENGETVLESTDTIVVMEESTADTLKTEESSLLGVPALPTPELSMDSDEDEKSVLISKEVSVDVASNLPTPRRGRPRKLVEPNKHIESVEMPSGNDKKNSNNFEDANNDASAPTKQRVPGDYTLTPLLLSEPETAWVICSVCSKAFVQRDAYYTRMSCPRCERHSKLYGYIWPKTEPEGKGDKEERILDHRLVHRFLHAEEEAKIRGRKWATWRSETGVDGTKEARTTAPTSGKSSLGSGIWRKLRYTIEREVKEQEKEKGGKATKATKATKVTKATKPAKTTTPTAVSNTTTARTTKASKIVAAKTATKAENVKAVKAVQQTARTVTVPKAFRGPRRYGRLGRTSINVARR